MILVRSILSRSMPPYSSIDDHVLREIPTGHCQFVDGLGVLHGPTKRQSIALGTSRTHPVTFWSMPVCTIVWVGRAFRASL